MASHSNTVPLFLSFRKYQVYNSPERVNGDTGEVYEIGDRITNGGNAVVHRCFSRTTGDEYAIKVQLNLAPNRLERFRQELRLLKEIDDEHLISHVDQGTLTAKIGKGAKEQTVVLDFLVMELADSNLKQLMIKGHKLGFSSYMAQFKGLSQALAKVHEKAIHRDIKPENILIVGETWKLSDFGLCKFSDREEDITEPDEALGPRYWMSPESTNQAIGSSTDSISTHSDVYQMSSVFWYVVTGRHPTGCVVSDDWCGTSELYRVLHKCLSHSKDQRLSNGRALYDQLNLASLPA